MGALIVDAYVHSTLSRSKNCSSENWIIQVKIYIPALTDRPCKGSKAHLETQALVATVNRKEYPQLDKLNLCLKRL